MTFESTIPTETQEGIVSHLESKTPFILYKDKETYARFYPNTLHAYSYLKGVMIADEKCSEVQFEEFIQSALSGEYTNFFSLEDEAPRANKVTILKEEAVIIDYENIANTEVYEEDRLLDGT